MDTAQWRFPREPQVPVSDQHSRGSWRPRLRSLPRQRGRGPWRVGTDAHGGLSSSSAGARPSRRGATGVSQGGDGTDS